MGNRSSGKVSRRSNPAPPFRGKYPGHIVPEPVPLVRRALAVALPELASSTKLRKLDLACGQRCQEGFEGVDLLAPNVAHRIDLLRFPWPFETASVDELYCSHFVEHIPAREVEQRDLSEGSPEEWLSTLVGQDLFFAFFDQCHRILRPGGKLRVIVPALKSERAFQDPTHRRFLPMAAFLYLSADWRKMNGLDHYRVRCDFGVSVSPTVPQEMTLLADEVQAARYTHEWNTQFDLVADLVALAPAPAGASAPSPQGPPAGR